MLTDFIKINPQTSEPQNYQKKNSSTFYDNSLNLPVPKIEVSLKKRQENLYVNTLKSMTGFGLRPKLQFETSVIYC